jgi:taurine dioxygenase
MREGSLTMLTQHRLSDVLGSAIEGIDLSRELADAEFGNLARALWEGGVLAIKRQRLAPGQFLAFARRFGRPEPHVIDQFHYPGYPDILILSNRRKETGELIGLADAGSYFHTDYSYLEIPARLTMLYSIEVPGDWGGIPNSRSVSARARSLLRMSTFLQRCRS